MTLTPWETKRPPSSTSSTLEGMAQAGLSLAVRARSGESRYQAEMRSSTGCHRVTVLTVVD